MCQSCDKSCLNFTQSEIKCQQKLPKLSDQVRQTTNRRKINQMWKVAKRGENAYLCDSHRSQGYLTCFLPAAAAPPHSHRPARRTPGAVVLSWLGHEQSKNSAALAEDTGRRLVTVGWKEAEGLSPRPRALGRKVAKAAKTNGKSDLDLEHRTDSRRLALVGGQLSTKSLRELLNSADDSVQRYAWKAYGK